MSEQVVLSANAQGTLAAADTYDDITAIANPSDTTPIGPAADGAAAAGGTQMEDVGNDQLNLSLGGTETVTLSTSGTIDSNGNFTPTTQTGSDVGSATLTGSDSGAETVTVGRDSASDSYSDSYTGTDTFSTTLTAVGSGWSATSNETIAESGTSQVTNSDAYDDITPLDPTQPNTSGATDQEVSGSDTATMTLSGPDTVTIAGTGTVDDQGNYTPTSETVTENSTSQFQASDSGNSTLLLGRDTSTLSYADSANGTDTLATTSTLDTDGTWAVTSNETVTEAVSSQETTGDTYDDISPLDPTQPNTSGATDQEVAGHDTASLSSNGTATVTVAATGTEDSSGNFTATAETVNANGTSQIHESDGGTSTETLGRDSATVTYADSSTGSDTYTTTFTLATNGGWAVSDNETITENDSSQQTTGDSYDDISPLDPTQPNTSGATDQESQGSDQSSESDTGVATLSVQSTGGLDSSGNYTPTAETDTIGQTDSYTYSDSGTGTATLGRDSATTTYADWAVGASNSTTVMVLDGSGWDVSVDASASQAVTSTTTTDGTYDDITPLSSLPDPSGGTATEAVGQYSQTDTSAGQEYDTGHQAGTMDDQGNYTPTTALLTTTGSGTIKSQVSGSETDTTGRDVTVQTYADGSTGTEQYQSTEQLAGGSWSISSDDTMTLSYTDSLTIDSTYDDIYTTANPGPDGVAEEIQGSDDSTAGDTGSMTVVTHEGGTIDSSGTYTPNGDTTDVTMTGTVNGTDTGTETVTMATSDGTGTTVQTTQYSIAETDADNYHQQTAATGGTSVVTTDETDTGTYQESDAMNDTVASTGASGTSSGSGSGTDTESGTDTQTSHEVDLTTTVDGVQTVGTTLSGTEVYTLTLGGTQTDTLSSTSTSGTATTATTSGDQGSWSGPASGSSTSTVAGSWVVGTDGTVTAGPQTGTEVDDSTVTIGSSETTTSSSQTNDPTNGLSSTSSTTQNATDTDTATTDQTSALGSDGTWGVASFSYNETYNSTTGEQDASSSTSSPPSDGLGGSTSSTTTTTSSPTTSETRTVQETGSGQTLQFTIEDTQLSTGSSSTTTTTTSSAPSGGGLMGGEMGVGGPSSTATTSSQSSGNTTWSLNGTEGMDGSNPVVSYTVSSGSTGQTQSNQSSVGSGTSFSGTSTDNNNQSLTTSGISSSAGVTVGSYNAQSGDTNSSSTTSVSDGMSSGLSTANTSSTSLAGGGTSYTGLSSWSSSSTTTPDGQTTSSSGSNTWSQSSAPSVPPLPSGWVVLPTLPSGTGLTPPSGGSGGSGADAGPGMTQNLLYQYNGQVFNSNAQDGNYVLGLDSNIELQLCASDPPDPTLLAIGTAFFGSGLLAMPAARYFYGNPPPSKLPYDKQLEANLAVDPDTAALLKAFKDSGGTIVFGDTEFGGYITFPFDGRPSKIVIDSAYKTDINRASSVLVYELTRFKNRAEQDKLVKELKAGRITPEQYAEKAEELSYRYAKQANDMLQKLGIKDNQFDKLLKKYPTFEDYLKVAKTLKGGHYEFFLKEANRLIK